MKSEMEDVLSAPAKGLDTKKLRGGMGYAHSTRFQQHVPADVGNACE